MSGMRSFAAAAALLLAALPAFSQDGLELELGALKFDGNYIEQVFAVSNSSSRTYNLIIVECGFFAQGKLIAADFRTIGNLAEGATGFARMLVRSSSAADRAQCRVSDTRTR